MWIEIFKVVTWRFIITELQASFWEKNAREIFGVSRKYNANANKIRKYVFPVTMKERELYAKMEQNLDWSVNECEIK